MGGRQGKKVIAGGGGGVIGVSGVSGGGGGALRKRYELVGVTIVG